jgi:hypothetical protein
MKIGQSYKIIHARRIEDVTNVVTLEEWRVGGVMDADLSLFS